MASKLQVELQPLLGGPVVMELPTPSGEEDTPLAERTRELLDEGVLHSKAVVLLQTARVLHQPTTVMHAWEAIRLGKPLHTVLVAGSGYDFNAAYQLLSEFASLMRQDGLFPEALGELLRERGADLEDVQAALSEHIPNVISVTYNPIAHYMQKEASIADIANRVQPHNGTAAPPKVGRCLSSRSSVGSPLSSAAGQERSAAGTTPTSSVPSPPVLGSESSFLDLVLPKRATEGPAASKELV